MMAKYFLMICLLFTLCPVGEALSGPKDFKSVNVGESDSEKQSESKIKVEGALTYDYIQMRFNHNVAKKLNNGVKFLHRKQNIKPKLAVSFTQKSDFWIFDQYGTYVSYQSLHLRDKDNNKFDGGMFNTIWGLKKVEQYAYFNHFLSAGAGLAFLDGRLKLQSDDGGVASQVVDDISINLNMIQALSLRNSSIAFLDNFLLGVNWSILFSGASNWVGLYRADNASFSGGVIFSFFLSYNHLWGR